MLTVGLLAAIALRSEAWLSQLDFFGVAGSRGDRLEFERATKVAWITLGMACLISGVIRGRRWIGVVALGALISVVNLNAIRTVQTELEALTAPYDEWATGATATLDAIDFPGGYELNYQSGSGVAGAHDSSEWRVSQTLAIASDAPPFSLAEDLGARFLWCSVTDTSRFLVYKTGEDQHLIVDEALSRDSIRLTVRFDESDQAQFAGEPCSG